MTSVDVAALGLGHGPDVLGGRQLDVRRPRRSVGPDGDLLHVDARARVEHRALLGHGDDRHGVAPALGGEGGAVDRVDGDVDRGRAAVADALAVVEHRRFVLLALADDDHAVHLDRAEHEAHGVDGGAVGAVLVAPAHPAGGGQGGGFGDPDELEGEVAIERSVRHAPTLVRSDPPTEPIGPLSHHPQRSSMSIVAARLIGGAGPTVPSCRGRVGRAPDLLLSPSRAHAAGGPRRRRPAVRARSRVRRHPPRRHRRRQRRRHRPRPHPRPPAPHPRARGRPPGAPAPAPLPPPGRHHRAQLRAATASSARASACRSTSTPTARRPSTCSAPSTPPAGSTR